MADIFRQMQKSHCHDGAPNGGKRPYGCPCCRELSNVSLRTFKKWSRRKARRQMKQISDEFVTCRKS